MYRIIHIIYNRFQSQVCLLELGKMLPSQPRYNNNYINFGKVYIIDMVTHYMTIFINIQNTDFYIISIKV